MPGNGMYLRTTYLYLMTWNNLESKEALLVKPTRVCGDRDGDRQREFRLSRGHALIQRLHREHRGGANPGGAVF